MLKKVLVTSVFAMQAAALQSAQAAPQPQAAPTNTHKVNQDKVRACRKEAAAKLLPREEYRAFIAQCVKAEQPPR
jgi:hypothetical protein